ncbi:unnamed protein product [Meloidogyne enterolobii]|uniref:Uncharacterized protein n=2 Tax=Meloidogyne enterolobii TaxID=390850 RepID=A0ACB0Z204_MELEN
MSYSGIYFLEGRGWLLYCCVCVDRHKIKKSFHTIGCRAQFYYERRRMFKCSRDGQLWLTKPFPGSVFREIIVVLRSIGEDVSDIKYVINYDYPNNSEDYVHRIGRTGRQDKTGTSYTFFTQNNSPKARDLIKVLEEAKQVVPPRLHELAESAFGKEKGKRRWRQTEGEGSTPPFNMKKANDEGFSADNGFPEALW